MKYIGIVCVLALLSSCTTFHGTGRGPLNRRCCPGYVYIDNLCVPCAPCDNYHPCIDHVDKYSCEDC